MSARREDVQWMLPSGYADPTPHCPPHERDANCSWYGCVPYKAASRPSPAPEPQDSRFTEHVAHVQEFLQQMYAIMIDPVEDATGNVADTCRPLLNVARRDRDTIHHLTTGQPKPSPVSPTVWQPIETAPLGQMILAYRKRHGEITVYAGRWDGISFTPHPLGPYAPSYTDFTLWQPIELPAPPVEGKDGH